MALSALNRASKVCINHARCRRLTGIWIVDSVASDSRRIYRGPRHYNRTNLRAHPGKQVSIENQCHERRPSGDRPGRTGMRAVHRKVLGNQNFLYATYSCGLRVTHLFHRVLPREERSLGDDDQGRQISPDVRKADARASRSTSSRHPIWLKTNLRGS